MALNFTRFTFLKKPFRVAFINKFFINYKYLSDMNEPGGLKLVEVVRTLEQFADLRHAEKWDNVGLLIEPSRSSTIQNILLTNDLTEKVLEEAIEKKINFIVSYHPPIFKPLNRITKETWKERIVASCLENRIAVFSPHTSWDSVSGGVTDWLGDAFKQYENDERLPLMPNADEELRKLDPRTGMGRLVYVNDVHLKICIDLLKSHTGLTNLRIAFGKDKNMDSIIACIAIVPGSGGSLLKDTNADLYVTGEMSHHDLLDANHRGVSVIITNHSDSERGFLKEMRNNLDKLLNKKAKIIVSECDEDPLKTV